jgi:hypothetical protein
MNDAISVIREALTTDTGKVFSPERENAIAAAGFPVGSYAILLDKLGQFEGIRVKPDYRDVSLDELIALAAARAPI